MKLNCVLVVFKRVVSSGVSFSPDDSDWQKIHEASVSRVIEALKERRISYELADRDNLDKIQGVDLIIGVGGDGTFLSCAHVASHIPLIGVNSMPGYSVGFFLASDADNFDKALNLIITDRLNIIKLPQIEVSVDGKPLPFLALNEMLFAGKTPAETCRYELTVRGSCERHKSSGVWIAAGPGSTAAIHSAGGKKIPIDSARIQFVVREPYQLRGSKIRLTRGLLKKGESISITSRMQDGVIYIDGPKQKFEVKLGAKITAKIADERLSIFRGPVR